MIKQLKENLKKEESIIHEISIFLGHLANSPLDEQKIILNTIFSLENQLRIINNAVPALINNLEKKIPVSDKKIVGVNVSKKNEKLVKTPVGKTVSQDKKTEKPVQTGRIMLISADKKKFLEELNIAEKSIKKLRKRRKPKKKEESLFKKPRFYAKLSNKFFLSISNKLVDKGNFKKVWLNMRKANMEYLLNTYVSMMFFSVLLSIFAALFIFVFLLFFQVHIESPLLTFSGETIPLRILKNFWILIAFPLFTFIMFYIYPSLEYKTTAKKIEQELPFVAIHMSAVAGSGIEPSQIFRIIASGKEYPKTKMEVRKLMNQVNVYGYDLVSALRNIAESTSSKKLSELFSGLATTITTGGSLTEFLDKRAETLLFDYKADREKYIRIAEIFMDIYLGVAIAGPMLLTLLLVMMGIGGFSIGISLSTMTLLIVVIIAVLNMIFITFLHIKQPQF